MRVALPCPADEEVAKAVEEIHHAHELDDSAPLLARVQRLKLAGKPAVGNAPLAPRPFAREWAWGQGSVADSGLSREFESLYTREERGRIIKLVRMMDFFNCLGNLFIRRTWKGDPHAASCPLPQAAPGQGEESGME